MRGPDFPWRKTRDALLKLVLSLFKEAREQGEFVIADPDIGALLLLGGLRAVIRIGPRPRPAGLARRIVQSFLQGADTLARGRHATPLKKRAKAELSRV
jgi:hypothetical protein